jgi:hypothetical protein
VKQENNNMLSLRIIPDISAFAMGLFIAWFFKWEAKDLIWSLWLGSLTVGYITIFIGIAAGAFGWLFVIGDETPDMNSRMPAIFAGGIRGIVLVGVFSRAFLRIPRGAFSIP